MKKLVIATCAAALMTAVSFGPVSAQSTGPSGGQDAAMKTDSPMNAQAKMKKKKTKMKKSSMMNNSGTTTGSAGASTNTTGGAGAMNNNKK